MSEKYKLIARKASTMKRLGQAGKDISMLFFYVGLDTYLKRKQGKLGLVITQTLCQSTAAMEFRRFQLPDGTKICVDHVDDWVDVDPFTSAANKTAVIFAHCGAETQYPLRYRKWTANDQFDRDASSLEDVYRACTAAEGKARLSSADTSSFWIIEVRSKRFSASTSLGTPKFRSSDYYKVRLGIETKLESAFRLRILRALQNNGLLLVENNRDRAKVEVKEYTGPVEAALVYPNVTGQSIDRWRIHPNGHYLVPHDAESGMEPISETEMKRKYRRALEFLSQFRDALENRSLYRRWGKGKPFYTMFDIGKYTFNPYRVAWKRTTKKFAAAVMGHAEDDILGRVLLMPNGKVMFIPCKDQGTAHFVCGLLNSSPARFRINSSISSEAHAEMINLVELPEFDVGNPCHTVISSLASKCHAVAETEQLLSLERELDEAVCELWKLPSRELKIAREAVREE
jgi:hypothetical protein